MADQILYYFNERGYLASSPVFKPGATSEAPPDNIPLGKTARWVGNAWVIADPDPGPLAGDTLLTTDRELLITTYRAKNAFTGASVGDTITATRLLDVSGNNAAQVGVTNWYNETTGAALGSTPNFADLEISGTLGLTDAQLRASAVRIEGSVASGSDDSGNPVKMGARYNASIPTYTDGQRVNLQTDANGNLRVKLVGIGAAGSDGFSNTIAFTHDSTSIGNSRLLAHAPFVFNGTSWDRRRGDVNGAWTHGNVASGTTDAGNQVKIGGRYNAASPTLTDGHRGDAQLDVNGNLRAKMVGSRVTGADGINNTALIAGVGNDSTTEGTVRLLTQASFVFNGTTWDRRRGDSNGAWTVGNVAAGTADAGNPIKVGAVFNAALPTLTDGQRGNLQQGARGSLHVTIRDDGGNNGIVVQSTRGGDAISNAGNVLDVRSFLAHFNGTTWDRIRGDVNGTWVQGNVAAGATDAGNPIKTGGVYNAALPTLTSGQRGDMQLGSRGSLAVTLFAQNSTSSISAGPTDSDGQVGSSNAHALVSQARSMVWNGATWDRVRGDTNGLYVQSANRGVTNVPIAAGVATSGAVVLGGATVTGILTPANLDGATTMTFSVSTDAGTTWKNVYDQYGAEVKLANGAALQANSFYAVDTSIFAGMHYVRFRWGTAASPNTGTAGNVARPVDIIVNR